MEWRNLWLTWPPSSITFFFCATQPPTLLAIFLFFFILFIYRDEERRWRRATHRGKEEEEEEEESWLHFSWQTASHPLNGRMHTAKLLHILYTTYTYSEKVGGWWGVIPAKNPRDSSYPQLMSRRRTPLIISKLPNANFSLSAFAVGDAWSMEPPDLNDQYIKPIQRKALTDFSNIVQVFFWPTFKEISPKNDVVLQIFFKWKWKRARDQMTFHVYNPITAIKSHTHTHKHK